MTTSVLSDGTIRRLVAEGRIAIDPWDPAMVQPASVDLQLGARSGCSTTTGCPRSTSLSRPRA